jgi:twitching motility protein PilT
MMLGTGGMEKRKSYRVFVRVPVVCDFVDTRTGAPKSKTAVSGDISSDGIYFEIDELLPLKSEVTVRFQLPHSPVVIQAQATIVRIESMKTSFGIGSFFTRISDEHRAQITRLVERVNINTLLKLAVEQGASDLHLLAGQPPCLRVNGELSFLPETQKLFPDEIPQMVFSPMTKDQIRTFEKNKELDFGIQYDIATRFRINVHQQRGFVEAALRLVESKAFDFDALRIPAAAKELVRQKRGLVLVAGATGSGKSTTLAAMVGQINRERKAVIITLERPIEFVFTQDKSVIKQREVGIDTASFSAALKSSLRQDPDVIVVGEMEDAETARTSVMAAEAGYLVLAAFDAPGAQEAVERLVNLFPSADRKQMLGRIADCLRGIVAQTLVPRLDRKGRVLTAEVLITNDEARQAIRRDELSGLAGVIRAGTGLGMISMADALRRCAEEGIIAPETL